MFVINELYILLDRKRDRDLVILLNIILIYIFSENVVLSE